MDIFLISRENTHVKSLNVCSRDKMLRAQRFEKTPAYVTRLKVELQKPECH